MVRAPQSFENLEHLLEAHVVEEGTNIGGHHVLGAFVASRICADAPLRTKALDVSTKATNVRL
jgi:hypothetical protein